MVTETLKRSILAGVYISLAGMAFLKVGGILGAILFGFGLLGVIQTGSLLYTGRIFFERNLWTLGLVFLGNVLGCYLVSLLTPEPLHDAANEIIATRINDTPLMILGKASFCGLIMTTAVLGARERNYWPLLLGVPFFVLSGFYHSVADCYYFMLTLNRGFLLPWALIIVGNYIGGKLYFLWTAK